MRDARVGEQPGERLAVGQDVGVGDDQAAVAGSRRCARARADPRPRRATRRPPPAPRRPRRPRPTSRSHCGPRDHVHRVDAEARELVHEPPHERAALPRLGGCRPALGRRGRGQDGGRAAHRTASEQRVPALADRVRSRTRATSSSAAAPSRGGGPRRRSARAASARTRPRRRSARAARRRRRSTISLGPRGQSKLTTGRPLLIASTSTIPKPSKRELSANTEARANSSPISLVGALERARSPPARARAIRPLEVGALRGPPPKIRSLHSGCSRGDRRERADQQVEALLPGQPARGHDHRRVERRRPPAQLGQRVGDALDAGRRAVEHAAVVALVVRR